MRTTFFLIASTMAASLSFASTPVQAQRPDYGYNGTVVRCESRDGRTERCSANGRHVQLVRQLSDSRCIRGRNWGTDSRGIWVSSGCRAEFRVGYGSHDDDDDDDGRYGSGYGSNYGNNNGRYGNDVVRCESRDNRSHTCAISGGGRGDIRLVRQLSDTPCIENKTWGRSRAGVWVTRGCRGEFVAGGGGRNGGRWDDNRRPPGDLGNRRLPGDLGDDDRPRRH